MSDSVAIAFGPRPDGWPPPTGVPQRRWSLKDEAVLYQGCAVHAAAPGSPCDDVYPDACSTRIADYKRQGRDPGDEDGAS